MKKIMKRRILSVILVIAIVPAISGMAQREAADGGKRTLHILGTVRRYEGEEAAGKRYLKTLKRNITVPLSIAGRARWTTW